MDNSNDFRFFTLPLLRKLSQIWSLVSPLAFKSGFIKFLPGKFQSGSLKILTEKSNHTGFMQMKIYLYNYKNDKSLYDSFKSQVYGRDLEVCLQNLKGNSL